MVFFYLFPYGFLREKRNNINRADLLVFSKVLNNNNLLDFKNHISESIKYFKNENKIYFSKIKYLNLVPLFEKNTSLNKIKNFIENGDKAKITLRFRGREMAHQEIGMELLKRVEADLEAIANVEQFPTLEGRQLVMLMAPNKK